MVFRRRDRRTPWRAAAEAVYPRGGWMRALNYIKHRLRRLPDSPEKIGRGMAAGVFISFTPLYGLHFIGGLVIAKLIRGNLIASLIGTFINNFVTLVPISAMAMALGYWILGKELDAHLVKDLGRYFSEAGWDLWHNFWAIFTSETMDWAGLRVFFREVFVPYFVGGVGPGVLIAVACYWVTVQLARAYQAGRRKALEEKLSQLRKTPGAGPMGR
ncbi:hypothetical protein Rumeso_00353 [Rubellimicrobium mesophilum DSM 19309]|uniref:DUF2062 domain-containing protein n=1 Tax=Rubellimicrobium mesophilum DSM 19309 TaxID=442562 RepID=A0A017HUH0_9RHOB|nr:DUF2062 domain-containing protein [Rubellimicrobium mesophilum]EYD78016.1 hypothetical protein Rumeso_00353 [Rubellimicrobium mesophilum DSM 19309]